jgi:hypothetical protein
MPKKRESKYDYESIDSGKKDNGIGKKDKIITEIKNNSRDFFEEQPTITIKKDDWEIFRENDNSEEKKLGEKIINEIFNMKDEISLSRSDVFKEGEVKKRIMKVLMWGYPEATMPISGKKNIINITKDENLEKLVNLFNYIRKKNDLAENEINEKLPKLRVDGVSGLGIATLSKLLYFFNVSFEGRRCLIYDSNVRSFLNHDDKKLTLCKDCYKENSNLIKEIEKVIDDPKTGLCELVTEIRKKPWLDNNKCYFKYLGLMNDLMSELKKDQGIKEKIENLIKEEKEKEEKEKEIEEKEKEIEEKEIEEKEIEEKIYKQIEFYMFTKGQDLGGGKTKTTKPSKT